MSLIVALDFDDLSAAWQLAGVLNPKWCRLKVGKAMFTRFGPEFVRQLHRAGFDVFLDLKYHDIPNTVADAVKAAADLGVWMVNVHASGGEKMLMAAREALSSFTQDQPKLIAVTVLTSLDDAGLAQMGINLSVAEYAFNLAQLSHRCGLDGVVCSAHEVEKVKSIDPNFLCVTPGIRLPEGAAHDQTRVMTPVEALCLGSDYLVMGRAITEAQNPREVVMALLNSMS